MQPSHLSLHSTQTNSFFNSLQQWGSHTIQYLTETSSRTKFGLLFFVNTAIFAATHSLATICEERANQNRPGRQSLHYIFSNIVFISTATLLNIGISKLTRLPIPKIILSAVVITSTILHLLLRRPTTYIDVPNTADYAVLDQICNDNLTAIAEEERQLEVEEQILTTGNGDPLAASDASNTSSTPSSSTESAVPPSTPTRPTSTSSTLATPSTPQQSQARLDEIRGRRGDLAQVRESTQKIQQLIPVLSSTAPRSSQPHPIGSPIHNNLSHLRSIRVVPASPLNLQQTYLSSAVPSNPPSTNLVPVSLLHPVAPNFNRPGLVGILPGRSQTNNIFALRQADPKKLTAEELLASLTKTQPTSEELLASLTQQQPYSMRY